MGSLIGSFWFTWTQCFIHHWISMFVLRTAISALLQLSASQTDNLYTKMNFYGRKWFFWLQTFLVFPLGLSNCIPRWKLSDIIMVTLISDHRRFNIISVILHRFISQYLKTKWQAHHVSELSALIFPLYDSLYRFGIKLSTWNCNTPCRQVKVSHTFVAVFYVHIKIGEADRVQKYFAGECEKETSFSLKTTQFKNWTIHPSFHFFFAVREIHLNLHQISLYCEGENTLFI